MPKSFSNLTFTESAHIGLNDDTPEVPLKIKRDVDVALDDNIRAVTIDYNISGSTAQSGDHFYEALHIDLDSTATGGDTSQETRVVGIKCNVTDSGDSNDIYGGYFDARASKSVANDIISQVNGVYSFVKGMHTAGEVKNLYGVNALVQTDNASSGTDLTSARGVQGVVQQTGDSGKVVGNAYGVYGKIDLAASSNDGTFTNCDGVYGEVEIDDGDVTISSARAVKAVIDSNGGTITSAYQFFGTTSASGTITNNWGIYLQNASKNYISGDLGINTSSPGANLHVVGESGSAGQIYLSDVDNGSGAGDSLLISKSGTNAFVYNRDDGQMSFGTNDTSNHIVIANTGNVTFSGTLTVNGADSITIPDYILHDGDDSKFGFPSNDNFKVRLAGSDVFTMSTTTATFTGDIAAQEVSATASSYSTGGSEIIYKAQRTGGAVAGDWSYDDGTTDMSLGTSTSHAFSLKTGDTRALTIDNSQNATFAGTVTGTSATFNSGITVDNITIDGTEIDLSSGDLTLDVAGDIILDAAGDQISMKDAGTERIVFNLDSTPELDVTGDFTIDGTGDITIDAADDVILTSGAGTHITLDETQTGGANTKFDIKTYYPDDVKAIFGTGASSDGDWQIYASTSTNSDFILESTTSNTGVGNMILRNNYQGDIEFADASATIFRMDNSSDALIINSGNLELEGTGRIQGVDTVTDSTDAANKAYVDAHTSGVQSISVGTGLDITSGNTPTITLDTNEMTAIDGDDPSVVDILVNDSDGGVPARISLANFIANTLPKQQTIINSNFDDATTTTSYQNIPFNYIFESSTASYYHVFACPSAGTVKRITFMHVQGSMTIGQGGSTTQLRVVKNGSTANTSSELSADNGSADGSKIVYEPGTTFANGDYLQFQFSRSSSSLYWRGVSVSIVLEFTGL